MPARIDPASALARLAAFVADTPATAHPDAARHRARLAFLDTIGCAIQGATTDTAQGAVRAIESWGAGGVPLIGTDRTAPAPWAALANGTAAHAMDLDDYSLVGNDHPSAVLVPAVLAQANGGAFTLGDVLDAYLIGLEVIFRVGRAVNMGHYNLGWHTTSTIDGLGATAAVARLMGLGAGQTASALSFTISMSSGMVSQFGTSAKPLHAGLSAKNGLVAATLARSGLTGSGAVLDGPVSLASLMAPEGSVDFQTALDGLGISWGIETDGLGAKIYPSCGYTHRAIDASLALHRTLGPLTAEQIAGVSVSIPDFHLAILPFDVPETPTEALFSTAWCVATALLKGRNTLADFSAEALQDEATRTLAARVQVSGRKPLRPQINVDPDDPDSVSLTIVDGALHTRSCPHWTGMPGADLSDAAFVEKFHACLGTVGGGAPARYAPLVERLLDDASTTPIATLFGAISSRSPEMAAH